MKSIKIAISFLLLALVLTGVSCQDGSDKSSDKEKEKEKKITEEEEYSFYENKSWGFEIQYPKDWKEELIANEYDGVAVGFLSPLEEKEDSFQENVVVVASEPASGDFDELMEEAIANLEEYEYGELIAYSKKTIAGFPAYELIYTDRYDKDIKKQLHCFINAGDVWYQLLYTAPENTFVDYLPKAKEIINSFKITK